MSNEEFLRTFLRAADDWACDRYSLDVRYLASNDGETIRIWHASILLVPLANSENLAFHIDTGAFIVGQYKQVRVGKRLISRVLSTAARGELDIGDRLARLPGERISYYSESANRERWSYNLHLQVIGGEPSPHSHLELLEIDNALRAAEPPFDGLADAAAWLGLRAPGSSANPPSIDIVVVPPVALIFDRCTLNDDRLTVTLHAHPKLDLSRIRLAVRGAPGVELRGRKQIADSVAWGRVRGDRRGGSANVQLENADSALVMLMIGDTIVQRQWIVDPTKARNHRLAATQHFDKDLRMLKEAVLTTTDSVKFEKGIGSLSFLLGFAPALQLEIDAPDLIVTTPQGKLIIVECTTRIGDFHAKVGKLVDRRASLIKYLSATGHNGRVFAALICRPSRDQITSEAKTTIPNGLLLVTGEDIESAFDRLRVPNDPDQIIEDALARTLQP